MSYQPFSCYILTYVKRIFGLVEQSLSTINSSRCYCLHKWRWNLHLRGFKYHLLKIDGFPCSVMFLTRPSCQLLASTREYGHLARDAWRGGCTRNQAYRLKYHVICAIVQLGLANVAKKMMRFSVNWNPDQIQLTIIFVKDNVESIDNNEIYNLREV